MKTFTMEVPIDISGGEVMASVAYTYSPGTPEVRYQRSGDPGWPAEPAEIEVASIAVNGAPVPEWFEAVASEYIQNWLHEHHDEPGPDPDDERDRRRDDALMGD